MIYKDLAPLIADAATTDNGIFFIIVDSSERHYINDTIKQTFSEDMIASTRRPPIIQYNLVNGSMIRFLAAGALDVLKAFKHADGVYIAPFASTAIDKADRSRIRHLVEQGKTQRQLKEKLSP